VFNKLFVCSQTDVEKIVLDEGWGVISIRGPRKSVDLNEGWASILPLEFNDLTAPYANFKCFDESLACELIAHLNNLVTQDTVKVLVIHCEHGVSRSQAVGMFVQECYAPHLEVPAGPRGVERYNKLVYNTLLDVYRGYSGEDK